MHDKELSIKLSISEERLNDLLISALDAGSLYWAIVESVEWQDGHKLISKASLRDGEGDEPDKMHLMTPALMFIGLQNLAVRAAAMSVQERWHLKPATAWRVLSEVWTEDSDMNTADIVLQMALFGEVLYG